MIDVIQSPRLDGALSVVDSDKGTILSIEAGGKIRIRSVASLEIDPGAFSNAVVSVPNVLEGLPVVYRFNAITLTGDLDLVLPDKTLILDAFAVATAVGGVGDTVQVKNLATAITNALDLNIADTTVARATTFNSTQATINAGGTLRVTGASAVNALVVITAVRIG